MRKLLQLFRQIKALFFFGQPEVLVTDEGTEKKPNTAIMCTFFGIKYRPSYPHTPWANGFVDSQKRHYGQFSRITTQQNNILWSDQAEVYNFAYINRTLTQSQFFPNEMVL